MDNIINKNKIKNLTPEGYELLKLQEKYHQ